MLPQEIIIKKRNGLNLSKEDINCFVKGLLDQSFSDPQIAAMTMAILINKMDYEETIYLTKAMANSGGVISWKNILDTDFICDKHSTGGVGDKVSLLLAPIIAACGGFVPMISGRGLGHTGGTLDKFDSIPGYNTNPDVNLFQKVVKEVGCAIIGQTPSLAPADKKLYAIRDVVGAVESIPLIVSSILSKKIASGINNLLIDVKVGNGSFNPTFEIANELGESLVKVADNLNLNCSAVLTDMNEILGYNAGNSIEVLESIEYLTTKRMNSRLNEITTALSAELICMNNINLNISDAKKKVKEVIDNGKAAENFEKMVFELGGPSKILTNYSEILPKANYVQDIFAEKEGYVEAINTRMLGLILIELGGGRKYSSDKIDYSVGFAEVVSLGDKIEKKMPLMKVCSNNKEDIDLLKKRILECFSFSTNNELLKKNIYNKITQNK